jgi:hypothetical protein
MLSEEHRLRVFENKMLRRVFGPKRDKVMGDSRKLYNKVLHTLYSLHQIKEDKMGRAYSINGGNKKCIQNFGWKG